MRILLFLFLLIAGLPVIAQKEPNKLALIVAISHYKPGTNWNDLASGNDVPLIKEALKKQGFKEENIKIIQDKEATKEGILNGIQTYLINKAVEGDICVFHFSGHGQQIYDNNNDEADGYDEALVTYDAPETFQEGTEKHLRDDDFGLKLQELRLKLKDNGELIVLVDACHSGSSTRSGSKNIRGTPAKYEPKNYPQKVAQQKTAGKITKVNDALFGLGDRKPGMAKMISFFASSSSELNSQFEKDGIQYGSLSMAFFKTISTASKQMSYQSVFDNIRREMTKMGLAQHPEAEGEMDKEIFGGKMLTKLDFYTASEISKDTLTINVGTVYSIFEGTTVKLFPADTRDTAGVKPTATGKIIKAGDFTSKIVLNEKMSEEQMNQSWIFLDDINFGNLQVNILLKPMDKAVQTKLQQVLTTLKETKTVNDQEDLSVEQQNTAEGNFLVFKSKEQEFLKLDVKMEDAWFTDTVQYRLRHFAWSKYFLNLHKVDTNIRVTFKIIPVKILKRNERGAIVETQELPPTSIKDKNGNIVMAVGENYNIELTNSGQERCYYTLLEIQPDGLVNSLLPGYRINENSKGNFLEPDKTLRNPKTFTIGPPYGENRILVITSREPLDFRPFLKKKDRSKNAANRGSDDDGSVEMDVMNTFYINYQIVPKKQ